MTREVVGLGIVVLVALLSCKSKDKLGKQLASDLNTKLGQRCGAAACIDRCEVNAEHARDLSVRCRVANDEQGEQVKQVVFANCAAIKEAGFLTVDIQLPPEEGTEVKYWKATKVDQGDCTMEPGP
jgi:hypothetical protein